MQRKMLNHQQLYELQELRRQLQEAAEQQETCLQQQMAILTDTRKAQKV